MRTYVMPRWLRTNVPHVCDRDRRGRSLGLGMYRRSYSYRRGSRASPASSLAMRRRLHRGLSFAMRTISATISGVGGRPRWRDFHAQNCANPRRCQAIAVSGFTIARASDHLDQIRELLAQRRGSRR